MQIKLKVIWSSWVWEWRIWRNSLQYSSMFKRGRIFWKYFQRNFFIKINNWSKKYLFYCMMSSSVESLTLKYLPPLVLVLWCKRAMILPYVQSIVFIFIYNEAQIWLHWSFSILAFSWTMNVESAYLLAKF